LSAASDTHDVPASDYVSALVASFLGWTLDAFDFFILVFVLPSVAKDFGKSIPDLALTITVTLAFRPVGALIFGLLADRYGRRLPLMIDLVFYSVVEVLSGLAPSYTTFLVLRALFGIGMGGEWGIGASLAPAATPDLTRERLASLNAAGIETISLSLDGSNAQRHDTFRGVPGTFDHTIRAAGWARELGIQLQVNTLVTAETLPDLPAIYELMLDLGIRRWSLFFLITMGRGKGMQEVSPGDSEKLMHWLYEMSKQAPFAIATTEATHYRRVATREMASEGMDEQAIEATPVGRGFGIRDGNGILFISHEGAVNPSGFLPVHIGNVRTDHLVNLYREHPVFSSLRDVSAYKGRCGRCEFVNTCGGSRARAFAWTGDYLESDPLCPFVPPVKATS